MDAHEARRVEHPLERPETIVGQVTTRSDVEAGIVVGTLDPIDITDIDDRESPPAPGC
jgi:hypothetical protein